MGTRNTPTTTTTLLHEPLTTTVVANSPYHLVVVHPLVLLSVVDHYTRVAKDTSKRVVGVLLGETYKGKVDITNSYAVPFEEDPKEPNIWYLDRQYHEDMYAMFKKINASEKIIGWYSTGPKIRPADLEINEMFRAYTNDPVLVIVDVNPTRSGQEIPTQAYLSIESSPEQQSQSRRQFTHLPSQIGAYEAEEVGVEHLLRDITDSSTSSMADQVKAKLASLKGLHTRLHEIYAYLDNVTKGVLPVNHQIIYNLQDMFNCMPDLKRTETVKAFATNVNDNMMVIYLSSLIRSITVLHDLINNKLNNKLYEIEANKTPEQRAEEKKKKEEAMAEAVRKKEEEEQKQKEKSAKF